MKSKRSKACDIAPKVKLVVFGRDSQRCIFCGTSYAMPNAHYIPRSKGGLGIEQNIITACLQCHHNLDQTPKRENMLKVVKEHLDRFYPNFTDEERIYKK